MLGTEPGAAIPRLKSSVVAMPGSHGGSQGPANFPDLIPVVWQHQHTRGHPSWERLCSFDQILNGAKTPEGCTCPAPPLPAEGEARARTVMTRIFFLRMSISEIHLVSRRQRVPTEMSYPTPNFSCPCRNWPEPTASDFISLCLEVWPGDKGWPGVQKCMPC